MNDVERRQLIEALIEEIQIYEGNANPMVSGLNQFGLSYRLLKKI